MLRVAANKLENELLRGAPWRLWGRSQNGGWDALECDRYVKSLAKNSSLFVAQLFTLVSIIHRLCRQTFGESMQATQCQSAERIELPALQSKNQVLSKANEVSLVRAIINGTLLAAAVLTWLVLNRMI